MTKTSMTPAMTAALTLLRTEGAIVAGANVSRRGCLVRVTASALRGLERRGLAVLSIGPDGGVMARVVEGPACVAAS